MATEMKLYVVVVAAFLLLKLASSKVRVVQNAGFEQETAGYGEIGYCAPLSVCGLNLRNCKQNVSAVLVTPENVKDIASFIISNAEITDHAIYFPPGETNEKLLQVPIRARGCFAEGSKIRITAGLDESELEAGNDRDIRFGITDGTKTNDFWVADIDNYNEFPPCLPADGAYVVKLLKSGPAPGEYTMVFDPTSRFGECSYASAAAGNQVIAGVFDNQLDLSKGLSLIVRRHDNYEQYRVYYILVEVLL